LRDGTTANAQILPANQDQSWLVYVTKTGELGVYQVAPAISPTPPAPTPPPPLEPQKLKIAIVVDPSTTTLDQVVCMASKEWRDLAASKHEFLGIIPRGIIEDKENPPPQRLLPFLERSSKQKLPWLLFADQKGNFIFEGPLPKTAPELTDLIKKYGG